MSETPPGGPLRRITERTTLIAHNPALRSMASSTLFSILPHIGRKISGCRPARPAQVCTCPTGLRELGQQTGIEDRLVVCADGAIAAAG